MSSGTASREVVATDGARIAVRVPGGEGPVVLLAHGVGSTSRFLREAFAGPMAAAGWRLATMDLRGHGESSPLHDPADHHLRLHAADVTVAAAAVGARVVGGVSLGGHAAVAAAAAGLPQSVRAAAAVLPAWTGRAAVGEGPHAGVAAEIRGHGISGMLDRLAKATDLPLWLRDLLVRDYVVHDPASLEAALLALDGGDAPTRADIATLGLPLALVSWPGDPGHPDAVARTWADAAGGPVSHQQTTIEAVGADREAFGRALVTALDELGVTD